MAKSSTVRLLLVRSGSTEWDDAGRLQGATDLPLSTSGREAIAAGVANLGGAGDPVSAENGAGGGEPGGHVSSVYCGPDEASLQTAELVAAATGARVKKVDELSEVGLGLWEGMLESELLERYPRAGGQWLSNPMGVHAPEGESTTEARERVVSAVARLLEKCKGGCAIALVMRPVAYGLLRAWIDGAPPERFWEIVADGPPVEWIDVPRDRLRTRLVPHSV